MEWRVPKVAEPQNVMSHTKERNGAIDAQGEDIVQVAEKQKQKHTSEEGTYHSWPKHKPAKKEDT